MKTQKDKLPIGAVVKVVDSRPCGWASIPGKSCNFLIGSLSKSLFITVLHVFWSACKTPDASWVSRYKQFAIGLPRQTIHTRTHTRTHAHTSELSVILCNANTTDVSAY